MRRQLVLSTLLLFGCAEVKLDQDEVDADPLDTDGKTPLTCDDSPKSWKKLGDSILPPEAMLKGGTQSRVAIAPDGAPVVAILHGDPRKVYVYRYNGTAWQQLGDVINTLADKPAYAPRIISAKGTLYVSVVEWRGSGAGNELFIYHYDGSKWLQTGDSYSSTSVDTIGHELTVDPQGSLLLATSQNIDGNIGERVIHVHRVSTQNASELTPEIASTNGSTSFVPDIAALSDGTAVVAYAESGVLTRRRTNDGWQPMGAGSVNPVGASDAHGPRIAVAANDVPYLAVNDRADGSEANQVFLMKFVNESWKPVGQPLDEIAGENTHSATRRLIADETGVPVIAWTEITADTATSKMFIARLANDEWQVLGDGLVEWPNGKQLVSADIAADGCNLIATFSQAENDTLTAETHVYRYE